MSVFDENLQKFENNFSISFDLSIWDVRQFGYILRIINSKNQEVDFVFVNFRGEKDLYLDFHSPITHKSIQIPVKKEELAERKWLPVQISFDLKNDQASVFVNKSKYECNSIGLSNPSRLKFVYGLYGLNLDVPRIAVKNIRITEDGKLKFTFPLNESTGEDVHDSNGTRLGHVKNAEWMINRHYYWEKKTTFSVDASTGVTYDEAENRVLIVNHDTIINYYLNYNRKENFVINKFPFRVSSGGAIYDEKSKKIYLYNLGLHNYKSLSMCIVNMKNHSAVYGNPAMENELHHHNIFLAGEQRTPYIFGGYGRHSYSDKIYSYNNKTDCWEKISFSGDSIIPRFFSAVGSGTDSSDMLIMGGIGNESGRLEHGGKYLYDLYSLDVKLKRIKKLWELNDVPVGFVPCSNLVLNENKTYFYTLCYPHHEADAFMQLYRFSIADGSYEIMSDSIALKSGNINTAVYLFYNKRVREFYSVIREYTNQHNSEVRIYSLSAPPVRRSDLNSDRQNFALSIPTGFLAIIIIILLFRFRKKIFQKQNALPRRDIIEQKERFRTSVTQKTNAIYVLGDFLVYDKKGTDISYRFSGKLKALFALILFHSRESSGISTEILTSDLWPDKDAVNAKNNRGVTINRLRGVLSDLDGISLVFHNSKWIFFFNDSFYCDFIESEAIIERLGNDKTANHDHEMDLLLNVLKRGALFCGIQEFWIDTFKQEYENKVEKLLWNYILNLYEHKKYAQLIRFSDLYFIIDPLNEDIMNLCMKAFKKLGKTKQAMILYNKFVLKYKDSMGEYPEQKISF
ncbi:MAG: hypothetical protein LBG96_05845 [Tannerella sp.]|nr:hypothetical protein [Tannerella sp.]